VLDDLDVECSSEVEFAEHFVVEVDVDRLSPALLCTTDAELEQQDEGSGTTNDIPCGQKKRPTGFEGPGSALDSMCASVSQVQARAAKPNRQTAKGPRMLVPPAAEDEGDGPPDAQKLLETDDTLQRILS